MGAEVAADADDYRPVIGLEVHVQLETASKIFCGCSTDFDDDPPNTHTCPVCLGLPGSLPVLNEASVRSAIKVGKAIDADIADRTWFHRKNYFYPDLPKNFQITQYDNPICRAGSMTVNYNDQRREIRIERAHLEEDPGSLQHAGGTIATADHTLVDYNRAGVPLLEIVTAPDFRHPGEVRAFLAKLEEMLEYLEVFDASRNGSLRVDANVSLVKASAMDGDAVDPKELTAVNRTEVKNISSHKGAQKALSYEITRQRNALRAGRSIDQETRHWDDTRGITVGMRTKEAAADYRYFREPDLPAISTVAYQEEVTIPELPDARRARFVAEYDLNQEAAEKLTSSRQVADFFEDVASEFDPVMVASWVADDLLGELNYRDMDIAAMEPRFDEFRRLIELVATEAITAKNAREVVLRQMLDDGRTPDAIVEAEGLGKADDDAIADIVETVVAEHPAAVEDYLAGEDEAINFLVGQVMQATAGRADPTAVNEQLRLVLDELDQQMA